MFNKPKLYNMFSNLQSKETRTFLNENISKIKWKGGDKILDIGSGDGKSTVEILKSYLPNDFKLLLGIDKSQEMVTFAEQHYSEDRVKFEVLEFGKDLPGHFIAAFDHVLSFFTLHWITDQRKALSQVYDVLSDDGECLLLLVGYYPSYHGVFRYLADEQQSRWSPMARDLDKYTSMYYVCEGADFKATEMMKDIGFKDVEVKMATNSFTFESEEYYRNFINIITPFELPEDVKKHFLADFVKVASKENFIGEDMSTTYKMAYIYGRK